MAGKGRWTIGRVGRIAGILVLLALVAVFRALVGDEGGAADLEVAGDRGSVVASPSVARDRALRPGEAAGAAGGDRPAWVAEGDAAIREAFRAERSDMDVQAAGTVRRVLPDDVEGSKHQRLLVALPSGHTVLIAHNIDLAPRVPVSEGDWIEFFGEYEHNDKGGVVHWTHHDPQGRWDGGWIRFDGRTYR